MAQSIKSSTFAFGLNFRPVPSGQFGKIAGHSTHLMTLFFGTGHLLPRELLWPQGKAGEGRGKHWFPKNRTFFVASIQTLAAVHERKSEASEFNFSVSL